MELEDLYALYANKVTSRDSSLTLDEFLNFLLLGFIKFCSTHHSSQYQGSLRLAILGTAYRWVGTPLTQDFISRVGSIIQPCLDAGTYGRAYDMYDLLSGLALDLEDYPHCKTFSETAEDIYMNNFSSYQQDARSMSHTLLSSTINSANHHLMKAEKRQPAVLSPAEYKALKKDLTEAAKIGTELFHAIRDTLPLDGLTD